MPEALRQPSLFADLLGTAFEALPAPIRAVHQAAGRAVLSGCCQVERGEGLLARALSLVMAFPAAGEHRAITVVLERDAAGETWTRCIGASHMRSRLRGERGLLVETMGPATFHFRLEAEAVAIRWRLCGVRAAGIPLPVSWFDVAASESLDAQSRYRFQVRAAVAGVGLLVAYDGTLGAP